MYKTYCSYKHCDKGEEGLPKIVYAYAKNKMGDLPKVYCCKECEGNDKHEERMVELK